MRDDSTTAGRAHGLLAFRWLRHPLIWLLAQAAAVLWSLASSGSLVAERVADTGGYVALAENPELRRLFHSTRTLGFPLFLRAVHWATPDYGAVPLAQLLVYLAMILLFWHGVRRYTGSPWLAFCAATPLFYAPILTAVGRLQADFLAAALALGSVALVFWLARYPAHPGLWAALVVAVTATYHVRPAYLYLLPLVPILALSLRRLVPEERRWRLRWTAGLAVALALPFIAYSGARWVVVGHFGLVSFGGYNTAGIATGLLDEELVAELPAEHRRLAEAILAKRHEEGLEQVTAATPIRRWHDLFNRYVWTVAIPAANELQRIEAREADLEAQGERARRRQEREARPRTAGEPKPRRRGVREPGFLVPAAPVERSPVAINRALSELAKEVLLRRPGLYLKWLSGGAGVAVGKTWALPWVRFPTLLLALAAVWAGAFRWWRRSRREGAVAVGAAGSRRWTWRSAGLMVAGLGYLGASLLLVILVEVPFDRYVDAMALLLPSALCGALAEWLLGRRARGETAGRPFGFE